MTNQGFLGQPRGLATLFFTEMWERFSYYGMRAILILFMTTDAAQEGLALTTETAAAVYGLYTAGVYLLTLPGGWLADNICLLYTSPSPRDQRGSRMPSSA